MSDIQVPLRVYWQPGCSSCLRAKEFLARHNVLFVSINVVEDSQGFGELAELGVRRVPIVRRGSDWVDGQVLADVARIAGIPWGQPRILDADELGVRIVKVMEVAQQLLKEIADDKLDTLFAQRPYTYRQHALHIFRIVEAFLDLAELGKRLEFSAYSNEIPANIRTKEDLEAFARRIDHRFKIWLRQGIREIDFGATANVYYGEQSMLEFLERTTWHCAQHTRQLELAVETLGTKPQKTLTALDIAGLPIPINVWDDTLVFG